MFETLKELYASTGKLFRILIVDLSHRFVTHYAMRCKTVRPHHQS